MPVEVRIEKPRLLQPSDSTVGKAVAEAAREELAALFQAGSRRRTFRIVDGAPVGGRLVVEGAIHELALGAPRENAAMLTFVVVLQANGRRRAVAAGRAGGAPASMSRQIPCRRQCGSCAAASDATRPASPGPAKKRRQAVGRSVAPPSRLACYRRHAHQRKDA